MPIHCFVVDCCVCCLRQFIVVYLFFTTFPNILFYFICCYVATITKLNLKGLPLSLQIDHVQQQNTPLQILRLPNAYILHKTQTRPPILAMVTAETKHSVTATIEPIMQRGNEIKERIVRNHDSPQSYDIVYFEHKLSWLCFGFLKKVSFQWR